MTAVPVVSLDWLADDLKVVRCSACGEVADGHNRTILARAAYRHAEDAHDGLVEREGW